MGLAQKLKSLKETFSRAARRVALVTGLLGSTFTMSAQTQQQGSPFPANQNEVAAIPRADALQNTDATAFFSDTISKLGDEDRAKINTALIKEAQDSYFQLLPYARDDYSRYLQSLEDRLNGIIAKEHPNSNTSVIVINPMQMDVGLALGMDPYSVSISMLQQQGVKPDFSTVFSMTDALTGAPFISAAGDTTYTQVPLTLPGSPDMTGHTYNVVVPISDFAPVFSLDNMSRADFINMVDRHEGWHSIDFKNIFPTDAYTRLGQVDQLQLATMQQQLNSPDYMTFVCWGGNSESYADLGACGDLIRCGKDVSVIDDIAAFRLANNQDVQHMTPPVLWELKTRIDRMGVEEFRNLSEQETHQLYNDIMDSAGLNPARLTLAYHYMMTPPNERETFIENNKSDPDFIVAFSYMNCFMYWGENPGSTELAHYLAQNTPPAPEIIALTMRVQAWDPHCELAERAFQIDGVITPVSLVKAYGQIIDELDDGLAAKDAYTQIEAQCRMVKLKNTFQQMVTTADYAALNADRGVDILKAKPELVDVLKKEKAGDNFKPQEVKTTPRSFDF